VKTKAKLTVKRVSKPRRAPNPKRLAEDEAEYRSSQNSIQSGRGPFPCRSPDVSFTGSIERRKQFWLRGRIRPRDKDAYSGL
jgi:hypothetical protein